MGLVVWCFSFVLFSDFDNLIELLISNNCYRLGSIIQDGNFFWPGPWRYVCMRVCLFVCSFDLCEWLHLWCVFSRLPHHSQDPESTQATQFSIKSRAPKFLAGKVSPVWLRLTQSSSVCLASSCNWIGNKRKVRLDSSAARLLRIRPISTAVCVAFLCYWFVTMVEASRRLVSTTLRGQGSQPYNKI